MQRLDMTLVVVVGALALFVGAQVAMMPPHLTSIANDAAASANDAASREAAGRGTTTAPPKDLSETMSTTGDAAPVRDLDAIRARIDATPGTYMPDMLVDLKHQLVRWPDRRQQGLRVWVQTITSISDWDLRYAQMARDAVADWGGDGLPIRFDFVIDSASADVRIMWLDRFPPDAGRRVGTTKRRNDRNGWLNAAEISVAIHDSAGATIRPDDLAGIVRHEAGHALGLGHSKDPKTKMYPVETMNDITTADRATLRLLYQLPPGVLP